MQASPVRALAIQEGAGVHWRLVPAAGHQAGMAAARAWSAAARGLRGPSSACSRPGAPRGQRSAEEASGPCGLTHFSMQSRPLQPAVG